MANLDIYEKIRAVPREATKEISGGRLNGMTDINPMWRIKTLTELFGLCGVGWKYEITKQWTEITTPENVSAFTNINLYVKIGEQWSDAIPGTGGSALLAKDKSGLRTNDDCYKMALTDALSVACKSLGMGADVYWNKDNSKYSSNEQPAGTGKSAAQYVEESFQREKEYRAASNGNENTGIYITSKQAKLLFDKSDLNTVKKVIEAHGYERTIQIEKNDFEQILKEVEDMYKTAKASEEELPYNGDLPWEATGA